MFCFSWQISSESFRSTILDEAIKFYFNVPYHQGLNFLSMKAHNGPDIGNLSAYSFSVQRISLLPLYFSTCIISHSIASLKPHHLCVTVYVWEHESVCDGPEENGYYSTDNVSLERIHPEGMDSDRWSSVTKCKKVAILTFQKADQGSTIQKSGFKPRLISIIITHKIIKYKW